MNITEDYVSFEVAKLLEEKGFEGDINAYYHIWDNGNKVCSVQEFSHSEAPHLYIPAPTHQMVMKWLREVHKLHIGITRGPKGYHITIETIPLGIVKYITREIVGTTYVNSYEEAVEAALKYSLENLI